MATRETFIIEFRADGSRVVKREITEIGRTSRGAVDSLYLLKRALRTLGVALVARELVGLADSFTNIQNRLRIVTKDTTELTAVMDELFGIARETRTSFEQNAELFNRLALATRGYGLSQRDVLDITETLNKAVIASGVGVREANNAMIQLSQGIAAGRLNGDELRSVLEQLPPVADIIAKQLGVTRGELRQFGREGKITTDVIIKAFQNAREEIAERFGKTVPTIGQSLTVLRNSLVRIVGSINETTGASSKLAQVILFLADNLETVAKIAGVVGAALTTAFAPKAIVAGIQAATKAMLFLNAAMLANPIGAIVVAIAAASAALYFFGDQIAVSSDGVVTLLDYFRAAFSFIQEWVTPVAQWLGEAFTTAYAKINEGITGVLNWFGTNLDEIGNFIKTAVASYIGIYLGFFEAIKTIFNNLPAFFEMIGKKAINLLIDAMQVGLTGLVNVVNSILTLGGSIESAFTIPSPDLSEWKQELSTEAQNIGGQIGDAFGTGFNNGRVVVDTAITALGNATDALSQRAREIAEARRLAEANAPRADLTTPGELTARPNLDSEGDKKRKKQLETIRELNLELEREFQLLQLSGRERAIQQRLFEVEDKLRQNSIKLSQQELDLIEQKIRALEELKYVAETISSAVDTVFGAVSNAIGDFIRTGEFNFRDFIRNIIAELAQLGATKFFLEPLADNIKGFITQTFGNAVSGAGAIFGGAGDTTGAAALTTAATTLTTAATTLTTGATTLTTGASTLATAGGSLSGAGGALSGAGGTVSAAGGTLSASGATLSASGATLSASGATLSASGATLSAAGAALSAAAAALSAAAAALQASAFSRSIPLPGFATGADFMVGGRGGVDNNLVAFRATRGERVQVTPPGQSPQGGGNTVNFYITTPDVEGFRRSESQIAGRAARMLSRAGRNS